MVQSPSEILRNRLGELRAIPPVAWSGVRAWAAKTKPLIVKCFPESLKDFETAIVKPPFPRIAREIPFGSQWDEPSDVRRHSAHHRDDAQQDQKAREVYLRRCQERHTALVGLIEGLLDVAHLEAKSTASAPGITNYVGNFSNSTVGAASIGAHSTATGTVTVGLSQTEVRATVNELQDGLMKLQDQLDDVDDRLYDFGSNLLRTVRKIGLNQGDESDLEDRLKKLADEAWVKDALKAMKPGAANALFKKLEAIASSESAKVVLKVASRQVGL